jgi:hypothetical protein
VHRYAAENFLVVGVEMTGVQQTLDELNPVVALTFQDVVHLFLLVVAEDAASIQRKDYFQDVALEDVVYQMDYFQALA